MSHFFLLFLRGVLVVLSVSVHTCPLHNILYFEKHLQLIVCWLLSHMQHFLAERMLLLKKAFWVFWSFQFVHKKQNGKSTWLFLTCFFCSGGSPLLNSHLPLVFHVIKSSSVATITLLSLEWKGNHFLQ